MSEQDIFEALFQAASKSKDDEGVVAACLVRDGQILAISPSSDDGIFHAEYLVIEQAKQDGVDITPDDILYTTLEPCSQRSPGRSTSDCTTAIIAAGIRRVVYGTIDPSQSKLTSARMTEADIDCRQINDRAIRERSQQIFNSTQHNPNKPLLQ